MAEAAAEIGSNQAYITFSWGVPPLKVVSSANRRGAQMKAPPARAPCGKYAGGVLELRDSEKVCIAFMVLRGYMNRKMKVHT